MIEVERQAGVLRLTLNRPKARNALNAEGMAALAAARSMPLDQALTMGKHLNQLLDASGSFAAGSQAFADRTGNSRAGKSWTGKSRTGKN